MNIPAVLFYQIVMIMFLFCSCACVMTNWEIGKRQKNITKELESVNLIRKHIFITDSILTNCKFLERVYSTLRFLMHTPVQRKYAIVWRIGGASMEIHLLPT